MATPHALALGVLILALLAVTCGAAGVPDLSNPPTAVYSAQAGDNLILITWPVANVVFNVTRTAILPASCSQAFVEPQAATDCILGTCYAATLSSTVCRIAVGPASALLPGVTLTPKPKYDLASCCNFESPAAFAFTNSSGTFNPQAVATITLPTLPAIVAAINVPNTVPTCSSEFTVDGSPTFAWFNGPLQPTYSWTVTVPRIAPEVVTYKGVSGVIQFSNSLILLLSQTVNVTLTVTDGAGNVTVVTSIVSVAANINVSPQIFGPSVVTRGRPALFLQGLVYCNLLNLNNPALSFVWSLLGFTYSGPVLSLNSTQTAGVTGGLHTISLDVYDGQNLQASAYFNANFKYDGNIASIQIVGDGSPITTDIRSLDAVPFNAQGLALPAAQYASSPVWVRCKLSDTLNPLAATGGPQPNSCTNIAPVTISGIQDSLTGPGQYRYSATYNGLSDTFFLSYFPTSVITTLNLMPSVNLLTFDNDFRISSNILFTSLQLAGFGGALVLSWTASLSDNTPVTIPPSIRTDLPWLAFPQGSGFFTGTATYIFTLNVKNYGSNVVIASGTVTVNTAFTQPTANVTWSVLPASIVPVDQVTSGLYKAGTLVWRGTFPLGTLFSAVVKSSLTEEEFALVPDTPIGLVIGVIFPTFLADGFAIFARTRFPTGAVSYTPIFTDVPVSVVSDTSTDYTDALFGEFATFTASDTTSSTLYNLFSATSYTCLHGGNTLNLNFTVVTLMVNVFLSKNLLRVVASPSDQASFATLMKGFSTCAFKAGVSQLSQFKATIDATFTILNYLASNADWTLSTQSIIDLIASLKALAKRPTTCTVDTDGRLRWRGQLAYFLKLKAMDCFENISLIANTTSLRLFIYKGTPIIFRPVLMLRAVCGVDGARQSLPGVIDWDLINDTAIPDTGLFWLSFQLPPNPALWNCDSNTRSLIHRGLFLDSNLNEVVLDGLYTLYLPYDNGNTNKPSCAFWNETTEQYESTGCTFVDRFEDQFRCQCNHLTDFIVLGPSDDGSSGLSTAAIAGIALGAVVGVAIIIVIGFFVFYKKGRCYTHEKSDSGFR